MTFLSCLFLDNFKGYKGHFEILSDPYYGVNETREILIILAKAMEMSVGFFTIPDIFKVLRSAYPAARSAHQLVSFSTPLCNMLLWHFGLNKPLNLILFRWILVETTLSIGQNSRCEIILFHCSAKEAGAIE